MWNCVLLVLIVRDLHLPNNILLRCSHNYYSVLNLDGKADMIKGSQYFFLFLELLR